VVLCELWLPYMRHKKGVHFLLVGRKNRTYQGKGSYKKRRYSQNFILKNTTLALSNYTKLKKQNYSSLCTPQTKDFVCRQFSLVVVLRMTIHTSVIPCYTTLFTTHYRNHAQRENEMSRIYRSLVNIPQIDCCIHMFLFSSSKSDNITLKLHP